MASNRHLARMIAVQTLYEWSFLSERLFPKEDNEKSDYTLKEGEKEKIEEIIERNFLEFKKSLNNRDFLAGLVWGTVDNRKNLDMIIAPAAPEWPISQIALVDLVILRLAIYELLFKKEVPPKVAINEAVELAKLLGGPNSSRFVNGVLGTVYRASEIYNPEEDKRAEDSKKTALKTEESSKEAGKSN